MKQYSFLFLLVIGFILFTDLAQAQKKDDNVLETVRLFPYQHRAEADSALTTMTGWGRSEWKSLFRLLDDDSLKASVADVLSAYVNAAALETTRREQTAALIIKYAPYATTNYARLFIRAQLDLLTDRA
ncbi:MAG TPA: hypothetical protein VMH27_22285, partial [Puia sp.]|nr:hypothetical protein [Puia sp.]